MAGQKCVGLYIYLPGLKWPDIHYMDMDTIDDNCANIKHMYMHMYSV